jgi:N-acetylmuramoyl-L-alanine amidase
MTFRIFSNRDFLKRSVFTVFLFLLALAGSALFAWGNREVSAPVEKKTIRSTSIIWCGVQEGSGDRVFLERALPVFEQQLMEALSPFLVSAGSPGAVPLRVRLHWMASPGVYLAEFQLGDESKPRRYGLVLPRIKGSTELISRFLHTLLPDTAVLPVKNPPRKESPGEVVILIDPGHGGSDTGTISCRGKPETTYNNLLSLDLAEALSGYGFRIVWTRKPDRNVFLDLPDREKIAFAEGVDFVISVHHDESSDRSFSGYSLYYSNYRPLEDRSGVEAFIDEKPVTYLTEEIIDNRTHMFYLDAGGSPDYLSSYSSNWFVDDKTPSPMAVESRRAADLVHEEWGKTGVMKSSFGFARAADYYMTRRIPCPGILIEGGFLSNREDERIALDPEKRKKAAAGIAAGIYRYFFP